MSAREVIAKTLTAIETEMMPCKRCNGYGYHHGFGEHGHDPDWCETCGGAQTIMAHDATKTPEILIKALFDAGYVISLRFQAPEGSSAALTASADGGQKNDNG